MVFIVRRFCQRERGTHFCYRKKDHLASHGKASMAGSASRRVMYFGTSRRRGGGRCLSPLSMSVLRASCRKERVDGREQRTHGPATSN
jgi:hypothetical protein